MNIYIKIFLIYILIINIYSLTTMYIDKHRAIARKWRIPEATLFLLAFIGGSIGIFSGMHLFHHKTKHYKFVIGIPLIIIFQLFLLYNFLL